MMRRVQEYFGSWKFLFEEIPPAGFRVFMAAYLVFCGLALLALAENGKANPVDRAVSNWAHSHPVLRAKWCQEVTKLGSGDWVRKGCAAGVCLLFVLRKWRYVPALLIGVLGEMAVNKWIQDGLGRPRPSFADVTPISAPGFPSGHTGAAAALFGFWILFLVVEGQTRISRINSSPEGPFLRERARMGGSSTGGDRENGGWRVWVGWVGVVVFGLGALAVGVSRVFLLAHWMTDVIGGYAFAAAWVLICFWINHKMQGVGGETRISRINTNAENWATARAAQP